MIRKTSCRKEKEKKRKRKEKKRKEIYTLQRYLVLESCSSTCASASVKPYL
jgi:hypothetical protein